MAFPVEHYLLSADPCFGVVLMGWERVWHGRGAKLAECGRYPLGVGAYVGELCPGTCIGYGVGVLHGTGCRYPFGVIRCVEAFRAEREDDFPEGAESLDPGSVCFFSLWGIDRCFLVFAVESFLGSNGWLATFAHFQRDRLSSFRGDWIGGYGIWLCGRCVSEYVGCGKGDVLSDCSSGFLFCDLVFRGSILFFVGICPFDDLFAMAGRDNVGHLSDL